MSGLSAHELLSRRERRAAALRRAVTIAVRRAERARELSRAERAERGGSVASFDGASPRGGRPGRQ